MSAVLRPDTLTYSAADLRLRLGSTVLLCFAATLLSLWMAELAAPWPSFWLPNAVAVVILVLNPRLPLYWVLPAYAVGVLAAEYFVPPAYADGRWLHTLRGAVEVALAWGLLWSLGVQQRATSAVQFVLRVSVCVLVAPALAGVIAAALSWLTSDPAGSGRLYRWITEDALGMGLLLPWAVAMRSQLDDPAPVRLETVSSEVLSSLVALGGFWVVAVLADQIADPDVLIAIVLLLAMQGMGFRAACLFAGVALLLQDLLLDDDLTTRFGDGGSRGAFSHWQMLLLTIAVLHARALVAELRRVSTSAQTAREQVDLLITSTHSLVVVLDEAGRVQHLNPTAERVTGYGLRDLRGFDWFLTVLPEAGRETSRRGFLQLVNGKSADRTEQSAIRTRSGEERLILWQNNPLPLAAGRTGMLAFGIDITERERAERALQASETRYQEAVRRLRLAVTSAGIGTWEFDLLSGALHWDPRMCELYGLERSQLTGTISDWERSLHPQDAEQVCLRRDRSLAERGNYDMRYRVIVADGEVRHIQSHAQLMYDASHRPLRVVGVDFDVTDTVLAQSRARQDLQRQACVLAATRVMLETQDDLAELARAVFVAVREQLDADGCLNYRFDGHDLRRVAAVDRVGQDLPAIEHWPLGPDLDGLAALNDAPLLFDSRGIARDPRAVPARALEMSAYVCYPLRANDGRLLGTLGFGSRRRASFSEADATLIQTLGHFMTLAWERHDAQHSAVAERARFLDLVDSVDGIVWEMEFGSDRFSFVSRRAERLLGFPLQDWYEDGFWLRQLDPDDHLWVPEYCLAAERRGENYEVEFRYRARDGRVVWVRDVVSTEPAPASGIRHLRGVTLDITERKRAEEVRRRDAELLQRTARIGSIGGWSYEPATDVLEWTEQTRLILQVDEHYRPNLDHALSFFADAARAQVAEAIQQALRSGQGFDLRLPVQTAGGQWIRIRLQAQAEFEHGQCLRLSGVVQDITQQFQAEQAAAAASSRLLLALRAGGIGIWEVDLSSGEQFWDAQMYSLLGVVPEDGEDALHLLRSTLDHEDLVRARAEVAAGHMPTGSYEHEYAIHRADGALRYLRVQSAVMPDPVSGSPRLVGATWDCTAQRELEAQLLQRQGALQGLVEQQTLSAVQARQRAERAAAMQAEFLANVSHELRTPLHAILGFLTLAGEELIDAPEPARELAQRAQERMDRSTRAAKRLLALVDDLLDLAKLESGRFDLLREPRQLHALLESALDELAPIFDARAIRVECEFDSNLPAILLDEYRVIQVFRNVLANAARFSPDGGRIWIHTRRVLYPPRIEVRVEDEGVGVPDDELEAIFDKFVQSSRPTAKKAGGTGLGLPIARKIMQAHGGEISASNRPQGGACFLLQFRCEAELERSVPPLPAPSHSV